MADTVTVTTLYEGPTRFIVRLTGISDGTGETAVTKVDISDHMAPNGQPATYSAIDKIQYSVHGYSSVRLYWDHGNDDVIALLAGDSVGDELCWDKLGGLIDPRTAGGTGDILLTTLGSAAATYDITIWMRFKN